MSAAREEETWTIGRLLTWTQEFFAGKGIDSPRLDAEVLLAHALGLERIQLYTRFDQPVSEEERAVYRQYVQRRGKREPVSLILGVREFYGREFKVTPDVLTPRPETEHLIDRVLEWAKHQGGRPLRLADVGTGSGCIAVTLACELEGSQVVATDVSDAALAVARANAGTHDVGAVIEFRDGDLLVPLSGERFDVLVSNPPYVEVGADLSPEVAQYEPGRALFSGPDGLGHVRRLLTGVGETLEPGGLFCCEIGAGQASAVTELARDADLGEPEFVRDLSGHERVLVVSGQD